MGKWLASAGACTEPSREACWLPCWGDSKTLWGLGGSTSSNMVCRCSASSGCDTRVVDSGVESGIWPKGMDVARGERWVGCGDVGVGVECGCELH